MEITAEEIYQKIVERAQQDPLVAEILRSCALEAALERQQLQFEGQAEAADQPVEG